VSYLALLSQAERIDSAADAFAMACSLAARESMHRSVQILGNYLKKAAQALQAIGDS